MYQILIECVHIELNIRRAIIGDIILHLQQWDACV
jgi:hypothetical protein